MRDTYKQLALRRSTEKHLTGWRWAVVVTTGSVVLLAALIMIGVGVAAKIGNGGIAQVPHPGTVVSAEAPHVSGDVNSTAPSTPPSRRATSAEAPVVAASSTSTPDSSVCADLTATYRLLVTDLVKVKPVQPLIRTLSSTAVNLLKGRYDASARDYNQKLAQYKSEYLQKTAANACELASSPFDTLTEAVIL